MHTYTHIYRNIQTHTITWNNCKELITIFVLIWHFVKCALLPLYLTLDALLIARQNVFIQVFARSFHLEFSFIIFFSRLCLQFWFYFILFFSPSFFFFWFFAIVSCSLVKDFSDVVSVTVALYPWCLLVFLLVALRKIAMMFQGTHVSVCQCMST